jgi:flagellar hook protein FlgE
MLRSLFSGITGLRAHQTMMDVVGNNIANVNTVGYKSSQAVFKDTLSQMLKGAGAPQDGVGGTNPAQIGLGVQLAGITTNFTQGAAQLTGRSTDMMISGDGFFVTKAAGEDLYTRAGSFGLDSDGRLVTPDGAVVQGWPGVDGVINSNGAPSDVKLPIGILLPPKETGSVDLGGNLPADSAVGATFTQAITTYDAQGNGHKVSLAFTKTAANTWGVTASEAGTALGTSSLTFDASGALTSAATATYTSSTGSATTLDLAGLTQYGGGNTATILGQDGAAMGSLQSFSIGSDGTLVGVFSNGLKQPLAQVALATFNNPNGLEKVGGTSYRSTVNSGTTQLGSAGTGGRGMLSGGVTEMSNVDLAAEFTNLIISQRGFQANSRVITASDEILQDLVNMKR